MNVEVGDIIYFEKGDKGLINKVRGRKVIFPHRSLTDVREGFFRISEIVEKETVIFAKGETVYPESTIPDVNEFLLRHPSITRFEMMSWNGTEFIMVYKGYLGYEYAIFGEELLSTTYLNLSLTKIGDIFVGELEEFKSKLFLDYFGFGRDEHDPNAPIWITETIRLRHQMMRKGMGNDYAHIPHVDHNIPIVVNANSFDKEMIERLTEYNMSMLAYWKKTGLKNLRSPDKISQALREFKRNSLWDKIVV